MSGAKRENCIFQPLWFAWNPTCLNSWERSTEDLLIRVSEFSAQTFILRLRLVYKLPAADGTWQIFYAPVIMSFHQEVLTCRTYLDFPRWLHNCHLKTVKPIGVSPEPITDVNRRPKSTVLTLCRQIKFTKQRFQQLVTAWSNIYKGWNGTLLFSSSWLLTFYCLWHRFFKDSFKRSQTRYQIQWWAQSANL